MNGRRVKRNRGGLSRGVLFFILVVCTMTVLYLWGKVRIEFDIRQAENLEERKNVLERELSDLRTEVHELKGYNRITELARARGLVFLEPARLEMLEVDLRGIDDLLSPAGYPVQVAGLGLPSFPSLTGRR